MIAAPRPVSLHGLTLGYGRRTVLRGLCCRFEPGTLTAVVGPNGAGKSTLLRAMAGLLRPREGSVNLNGMDARQVAYLPQQADIDRSFPISVLDMVALGHWPQVGALGGMTAAQWEDARAALAAVGMRAFAARGIGALSAGQFQRVQFARLLLQNAPVILLDEPFTALDAATTEDLLRLVRAWHDEGRTVLAVIHDLDQVRSAFPLCLSFMEQQPVMGPTACVLPARTFHMPTQDHGTAPTESTQANSALAAAPVDALPSDTLREGASA